MNLKEILETEILAQVEKPSRYLGTEVNVTVKDPSNLDVRMVLCFPDLYDLGLGNLGIHILYTCVNSFEWASCERVFAPAPDMERELRSRDLPLFALESKDSLDQFDGIGFTLQSELTYTNILNILDMAGIPLRTEDRTDGHPLTFAGGPAVFNPEPIAPFIDFFVIGDGEDAIVEITHLMRKMKGASRQAKLMALSMMEGVYVPALYPFETLDDGRVVPKLGVPKIRKRITRDLNGSTFPVDYIVPYTKQVHDRISLEVLRGCTQGCRFCQAGMVTRPVRERKLERVDELLNKTLATTGYEEVSLVSLSTCDYSRVRQLVENTVETVKDKNVAVSLPSLRLDSFSVDLADMVADTRRTGLTVAPEAASPRLRAVINKWIPDDDLLRMAERAFELKWSHVKLYFMIGLPTERDDDILAISDLAKRTLQVGREHQRAARVNLGVSTFVPKPFTPFQWAQQIPYEEVVRRQDVLSEALGRDRSIKFGRHHPAETFLEGLVSRADRRAADLIELAYRKGCRFDAWDEHLDFSKWREAVDELGYDVDAALRERSVDERLPWDHIDVLIPKEWFVADWERAKELQHAPDCRHKRCHKCGVIDEERELCASMLRDNIDARKLEKEWVRKEVVRAEPKPVVQCVHLRIARTGNARFLSHLEAMSTWIRALRRAQVPLAYSQGFHPHPKVAFSSAIPMGQQSVGDYMEIRLTAPMPLAQLFSSLNDTLPEGFEVLDLAERRVKAPAVMSRNHGGEWVVQLPDVGGDELRAKVDGLLAAEELLVQRSAKVRKKGRGRRRERVNIEVDVKPMIVSMQVEEGDRLRIRMIRNGTRLPKVNEVLSLLTEKVTMAQVIRVDTYEDLNGEMVSLSVDWPSGERQPAPEAEAPAPHAEA